MKKEIYPSLNGLRALSIIFVIFSHIKSELDKIPILSDLFYYIGFISDGQFGVNVFFVISGFLITILLLKEEDCYGRISLKKFYLRRFFRIFPAYYFLLLVYAVLTVFSIINISQLSWLTAITYTKYFNWSLDWFTAHAWSLSIEEHFYLMWPFVFLFGKKLRLYFLIGIIVICPFFRVYGALNDTWMDGLTIFQRLDSIALGCLVAMYYKNVCDFILRYKMQFIIMAIIWILIFPYLTSLNIRYSLHLGWFTVPFGGSVGTLTNLSIVIFLIYSLNGKSNYFYSLLNSKPLNYIGILSYNIYLWQQIFTSSLIVGKKLFPYNLIFIAICSLLSFYLIEKPFLKLKNKFSV